MADAIFSAVAERIIAPIKEQIRNLVNLVRGVKKEIRSLSYELKQITNVLDDAENRRFKDKNINNWLSRLEQTSYEMDHILDEWNYASLKLKMENDQSNGDAVAAAAPKQKVCSFILTSCLCFKKVAVRLDIAKKIQNVKVQLDEILREKDRYNFVMSQPTADPSSRSWRDPSTSFADLAEVCGRDSERDILVAKLVANYGRQEELGIQVLSIVGVGGLGKTTLAQLVYSDSRVEKSFDLRIWVCVSDPFDLATIAKGIIESVRKENSPSNNNLDTLLQHVRDCVLGKKILLVLDDVWIEDSKKWEPLKSSLKCGGAGSKILATTRNERAAKIMGTMNVDIHRPGQLSNEDCWLLLRNVALSERNDEELEKLEEIGKKIVEKCNGLPLAVKTLGSLLRFKATCKEWENVLNSELWKMEEAEVELFPHLLLSYNELSPKLKRCFSYCSVFPKDYDFEVEDLIRNWMALGYLGSSTGGDMELEGRECFNILAMRSLFQDFEKDDWNVLGESFKMHDIVHDFAQFVRKSGRVDTPKMNKTTCQSCDPLLVFNVNEFCSLFWDDKESPPNLCGCLTRLRVLSLMWCGLQGIPQGMENLIHLRRLNLDGNKLSGEDLKIVFQLYNLQTLSLNSCSLEEIPTEIGNLVHLRHLNLSSNEPLKELPESICGLVELRSLKIDQCKGFSRLPEGIYRLINLKDLQNGGTRSLMSFPQGLAQLTSLHSLNEFRGGSGLSKLGLLNNLNHLSGHLNLYIRLANDSRDVIEDAREAELNKKIHIQKLKIEFENKMDENEESSQVRMDVMDALEPHPCLRDLDIYHYKGSKLAGWITSPLNKLKHIRLKHCYKLPSLPPLGKLQCLEEIHINELYGLQFVGREFLGITTRRNKLDTESTDTIIAFPKLKKLTFEDCYNWKEWEDITAEEEECAAVSLMPCLTELWIFRCHSLAAVPYCLLGKMMSLENLSICDSTQLTQLYAVKDGSARKSIHRHNPRLQLFLQ